MFRLSVSLLLLLSLVACQGQRAVPEQGNPNVATADDPARSPSGDYQLRVDELSIGGSTVLRFAILDAEGQMLFFQDRGVPPDPPPVFLWDEQGRVWMYAPDEGTFYWKQSASDPTVWKQVNYADTTEAAPAYLRQLFPAAHPR